MTVTALSHLIFDVVFIIIGLLIRKCPENSVFCTEMDGDEKVVHDIARRISSVFFTLSAAFILMDMILWVVFRREFPFSISLIVKVIFVFMVEKYYGYRALKETENRNGLGYFGKKVCFPILYQ